jgi:sulfur-oxidizing protein SoxA
MRKQTGLLAGGVALVALVAAGSAIAEKKTVETADGISLTVRADPPEGHPLPEVISGFEFRKSETQDVQLDEFQNPGFLWVERGETIWNTVEGEAGKSCASCHGDVEDSMKGVGASMPKWNENLGKPVNLEMQIDLCRTEEMGAKAYKFDEDSQKALVTYIRSQSRGMPIDVQIDGPMEAWWDRGKEIYYKRSGQLNMACANCHEDNYGNHIRADYLSQGQSNGFPTYRLKSQGVVSLHNRFKGCMRDVRATPYTPMSDEFLALELYVAWRGTGLTVETPAVRN